MNTTNNHSESSSRNNTHYGSLLLDANKNKEIDSSHDDDENSMIIPTIAMTREAQLVQSQNRNPFFSRVGGKQKRRFVLLAKVVIPLLALVCGTYPLLVSIPTASVTKQLAVARTTPIPVNSTAAAAASTSSVSPFFEHVLEWKEIPLQDAPSDYDHNYQRTVTDPTTSNHYKASIEFCSDPSKGLYGYGPVGKCVPGKPAPLIRMKPKTFYHLTLYNNASSGIDTNIHTHGLHVSGVGTVDDVTRVARPGECLTYDYYILDDADVGTFWYHPHRHPLVTTSAYGGAYGMLIVDETVAVHNNNNNNEKKHDSFYPKHLVNFLTQNEVLLQFSSMYNKKLENAVRSNKVNGLDHLTLTLSKQQYYYFRVSSVVYAESVNYMEFYPPSACEVRVVAYDGVYRSEIPGSKLYKHMMTVSSRGDFAVKCSKDAVIHFHQGEMSSASEMVTIRVAKDDDDDDDDGDDDGFLVEETEPSNDPSHVSLPATLPSSPYWHRKKKTTWKPRRPYYMPDLSLPTNLVDEYWSVSMDDYFLNGTKGVSVNQHWWDPEKSIRTFDLGQLIEYPILLSQTHPYHAHINRMQIVEKGGCGGRFEEGEYFDTIVQSKSKNTTSGGCTVRTKFFDYAGRIVIHCHRFGHEDQGMMTWIDVLGGHGHGIRAAPPTSCDAVL